jgi:hypothetical protein
MIQNIHCQNLSCFASETESIYLTFKEPVKTYCMFITIEHMNLILEQ